MERIVQRWIQWYRYWRFQPQEVPAGLTFFYLVITHDLRVLLEELEFFTQWLIRDGEDLVFPWVNYTSREMIDQYVFNYTFAAGEIIELSGQTAFRTYRIVEEAYIVNPFSKVRKVNSSLGR